MKKFASIGAAHRIRAPCPNTKKEEGFYRASDKENYLNFEKNVLVMAGPNAEMIDLIKVQLEHIKAVLIGIISKIKKSSSSQIIKQLNTSINNADLDLGTLIRTDSLASNINRENPEVIAKFYRLSKNLSHISKLIEQNGEVADLMDDREQIVKSWTYLFSVINQSRKQRRREKVSGIEIVH